jgi:hypothetical protein
LPAIPPARRLLHAIALTARPSGVDRYCASRDTARGT